MHFIVAAVDVASIDRRDIEREYESTKRVDSLVEAFTNSAMHRQTLQDITAAMSNTQSAKYYNGFTRSSGPSYSRVLFTLIG